MVLPGQYLERPALVVVPAAGNLTLEGLYHRGRRRPSLLVCPDPGPGGGMDAPPVAELAWACARAGHPSLRFQHRGRGASQGAPEPSANVEDALAALAHLIETAPGPVAIAGVGAGCETTLALARCRPEIARAVLVAPPAPPAVEGVRAGLLAVLPEDGPSAAGVAAALGGAGCVEVIAGADGGSSRASPRWGSWPSSGSGGRTRSKVAAQLGVRAGQEVPLACLGAPARVCLAEGPALQS